MDVLHKASEAWDTKDWLQQFNDLADYDRGDVSKRAENDPLRMRLREILDYKEKLDKQLGGGGFLMLLKCFVNNYEKEEIIRALIDQDVDVGSIGFDLEDTHLEQDCLKMIATLNEVEDIPLSTKISTKDWIDFMKKVTDRNLSGFFDALVDKNINPEVQVDIDAITEFRAAFIDYIEGVRPLVRDCEKNGSVMVINQNSEELSYDGLPLEQSLLQSRAVEHYKRITEKLQRL